MIRKIFAVLVTIITLLLSKETIVIFTSTTPEIVQHRRQLIVISLSILLPLIC
jgi:Na+-driven multidrug efflux pump